VEIAPAHRVPGYENYATFQPVFACQSAVDLLAGLAVICAGRRFLLAGDRLFALFLALFAAGTYATEALRVDFAHHVLGLRVNQWVMIVVFAGALVYLYLTRHRRGPDKVAEPGDAHPAPAADVSPAGPGGQEMRGDVIST
jgi:phosphatidylglycerol---prolipoprotein diacylglyceryl transferase